MSEDRRLLESITEAHTRWFQDRDPSKTFDRLLSVLLSTTGSEYGFIGEVFRGPSGQPYLKEHAITNIAWNDETRRFYEENAPAGLEFHNLKTLYGAVMVSGEPVISNDPSRDPRRGGLPEGHPPLNSFLGLPLVVGEEMVGMIGIANRPGGYDEDLVRFLAPFLSTCGNLIHAFRSRRERDRALARAEEEKRRLQAILDGAVDAIVTINEDGSIESANPSVERVFGYLPGELVGRNVSLLISEPHRSRHDGYIRRYLETGEARVIGIGREVEGIRKDGSSVPVDLALTEVMLPDRVLFTGILRDISRRREAERALRDSEERLELALRGADLGMWDWNIATGELARNERLATMLGYDPSGIEPRIEAWERLVHPDDMPVIRERLRAHFREKLPFYEAELRLRDRSGEWRWVHLLGQVFLRAADGKPLRAVGIQRDISRRKEAEMALRTALEEIRKSHDDLLAVLNRLRIGTVLVEGDGTVSFVSEFCDRIEGVDRAGAVGRRWEEAFPFDPRSREAVREAMGKTEPDRARLALALATPSGQRAALECDVRDDPREPGRRILVLYDVTETQTLRTRLGRVQASRFVGSSPPMVRLYESIEKLSAGDWTVLIEGETGVGKELVARAIHAASPRRGGPFLAVNCAGLSESLLSSQLFGHRRGAFTGAVSDQEGYFEAAAGGTIFLDEIGDIPPGVQMSLLRVLQEKEITRLGEARPRKVDARILAATHRDLVREVGAGRFREDLFYRVRVARLTVPPLRERKEDIPLLVTAFLGESRIASGKPSMRISDEAIRALSSYSWPGNVRELQHAIEHAVIHAREPVIRPADLPPEILASGRGAEEDGGKEAEGEDERERLLSALRDAKGNRSLAAKRLGIGRATLYRRIRELGI